MTPSEHDPKAVFTESLRRDPGPERTAFLDQACGDDDALRSMADARMKAHGEAGDLIDPPPGETTAAGDDPAEAAWAIAESPGDVIGPYKLLQKIGEGGMGAVFMAEQEKPVRRKVALKVIKPGMDTRQVLARFEAERQALAIMEHPNIARVFDVGATAAGRPYFVMELVHGLPITDYCDRNHLTPRGRLELFIHVCQAVQHAHQKGIIHRDVKPSNVLITEVDGRPTPKVIDFGIAKAIDQNLTEKTLFTEFGAVIGTLEYMSPEQAGLEAMDVDTRSDVYSLGVLLYELLTGSTPLERATLRAAGYPEILRRIREEEPPSPSSRLSESTDTLPSISAQRNVEPARLAKLVLGDLDWIVMKSLEKDRKRRYETASGFAADVRRHLDGDPVEACPPSRSYRIKKFARKHRAGLAMLSAFTFVLVAATAISAALALWANEERGRAANAEALANTEKARARDRERTAIDAVKRFSDVVRDTPELRNDPSFEQLRAKLLREPLTFFKTLRDRLQADRETKPDSLQLLAEASSSLGSLTNEIGDKEDALKAHQEALAIYERLAAANPSIVEYQANLIQGQLDICVLQNATGRTAEALASSEQALAISKRLAAAHPSVVEYQKLLAQAHNTIGVLQRETGRLVESLASCEQALAIYQRLAAARPSVVEYQVDMFQAHTNLAATRQDAGRIMEALASYEQALAISKRLAAAHPSVVEYQKLLAQAHNNVGVSQRETGRIMEALASYEKALAIQQRLAAAHPSVVEYQKLVAQDHNNIGTLQRGAGRIMEALASYEKALAIQQRLAAAHPSVVELQAGLAHGHDGVALMQDEAGRTVEALASYERGRAIWERLAAAHPESADFASFLGGALNNLAMIDIVDRRFDEATAKLRRAVELQSKALTINPRNPMYRQFLANHLNNLIKAVGSLGRAEEADSARRKLAELGATDPARMALDERLGAVLKGQTPKDDGERLRLAVRAYETALHAAAAGLFAEALANDPRLGDDRRAQHRYNAACAAALSAAGQGKDEPPPDDDAKSKLRGQALDWLRGELDAWTGILDSGPAESKAAVTQILKHWKADADLASIRDEQERAKLPATERAGFKQLWEDVDRLLAKAARADR